MTGALEAFLRKQYKPKTVPITERMLAFGHLYSVPDPGKITYRNRERKPAREN